MSRKGYRVYAGETTSIVYAVGAPVATVIGGATSCFSASIAGGAKAGEIAINGVPEVIVTSPAPAKILPQWHPEAESPEVVLQQRCQGRERQRPLASLYHLLICDTAPPRVKTGDGKGPGLDCVRVYGFIIPSTPIRVRPFTSVICLLHLSTCSATILR